MYPEIKFGAAQVGEPGDLTVYAEASTVTGASLPDGTYSWTFDGVEESGPVSTHGKRYHTFARAGVHTVTLSVLLFGMAGEISCTTDTSSDKQLQVSLNDAQRFTSRAAETRGTSRLQPKRHTRPSGNHRRPGP